MVSITSGRRVPSRGPIIVAGLLAVAVAAAVTFLMTRGTADADTDAMLSIAPGGVLAESDIPAGIVGLYRGADAHADVFSATPCFCGCEAMLGHRHLLDCFERPDGSGWEAHALGCAVCLGEAQQVLDLVAAGTPTADIVQTVIDEWSDPYLSKG